MAVRTIEKFVRATGAFSWGTNSSRTPRYSKRSIEKSHHLSGLVVPKKGRPVPRLVIVPRYGLGGFEAGVILSSAAGASSPGSAAAAGCGLACADDACWALAGAKKSVLARISTSPVLNKLFTLIIRHLLKELLRRV